MDESVIEKQDQKIEVLSRTTITLWKSLRLLNWIGYGFLLFAFFDLVSTVIPLEFTNARWELNLVGNIVERVAAPLIGFGLVFLGGLPHRPRPERLLLKVLSWLTLVVGILYLPLIGLGISSTLRIDRQNNERITIQATQTRNQLGQVQDRLNTVNTIEDLQGLLVSLNGQGKAPEIKNQEQFDNVKGEFNNFLGQQAKQLPKQVQARRNAQRQTLFKNAVKWCLGALLSSVLFITIWRSTVDLRQG